MIDNALQSFLNRRQDIAARPNVRFFWQRSIYYGPGWVIGVAWGKRLDAAEGETIYRHVFELYYCVKFKLRRH